MSDSILDLSLAKIKEADLSDIDVSSLIASEEAGKTRSTVIAYLKGLIAPPPPAPPESTEDTAEDDEQPAASAPVVTPEGVEIECTVPNVHLGDGRQLNRGERAFCNPALADLIVGNGQATYV